ncbi:MAG TPA: hypothetical protein DCZ03_11340 [Gammaproteobacteria bacterium]|nr:hypothetical protein [Gammaproteobacteria bacterium]
MVYSKFNIFLHLMLIMLLTVSKVSHAEVSAHLSRSIVYEGEQVNLTIRAQGSTKKDAPDLSPLEADFEILGTAKSEQFRSINGQTSHTTEWTINLIPKKLGKLELPPLTVGHEVTYPLQLEVIAIKELDTHNQAPLLFIESNLDNDNPYVQQQSILTVKLYIGAELKEGTLSEPNHSQFVFESLGEQKRYDELKYGVRYSVVERRYALFAQQSGNYVIDPILFSGTIIDPDATENSQSFGNRGWRQFRPAVRKLSRKSPEISIQVQPKPNDVHVHWMPATSVKLTEDWSRPLDALRIGEPITRTIRLEVTGQRGSQLKNIDLQPIQGWQIYPDQATIDTRISSEGVTGILQRKFALVPESPGETLIPALKIHWWDTISDQPRIAELPDQIPQVLATQAHAGTNLLPQDSPVPLSRLEMKQNSSDGSDVHYSDYQFWKWLAVMSVIGWISTVGFFWLRYRKGIEPKKFEPSNKPTNHGNPITVRNSTQTQIFQALEEMDTEALKESLIHWSQNTFPQANIKTLIHLADFVQQTEFEHWIRKLESSLYGQNGNMTIHLQKATMKQWLDNEVELHKANKQENPSKLPPLYPAS